MFSSEKQMSRKKNREKTEGMNQKIILASLWRTHAYTYINHWIFSCFQSLNRLKSINRHSYTNVCYFIDTPLTYNQLLLNVRWAWIFFFGAFSSLPSNAIYIVHIVHNCCCFVNPLLPPIDPCSCCLCGHSWLNHNNGIRHLSRILNECVHVCCMARCLWLAFDERMATEPVIFDKKWSNLATTCIFKCVALYLYAVR